MDRAQRLAPLGPQRLRVLDCLGGNNARAAGYLRLAPADEVCAAFRAHMLELSRLWAQETSPQLAALLAAGRLLSGEIAAARELVDALPAQPFRTDHGAGYCLAAPAQALKAALPWPAALGEPASWTAGSPAQAGLRDWLAQHEDKLRWSEAEGVYALPGG